MIDIFYIVLLNAMSFTLVIIYAFDLINATIFIITWSVTIYSTLIVTRSEDRARLADIILNVLEIIVKVFSML